MGVASDDDRGAARIAGLFGLIGAVLFAAVNLLWVFEQPAQGAPAQEIVDFYGRASDAIVISGLGSLVAYAALIVFASALRQLFGGTQRARILTDVAFGATLFAAAAGAGAETVNMAAALRAREGELDETLGVALFDISFVLGGNVFAVGLGLLVSAMGLLALSGENLLPRWMAFVSVLVGAALISPVGIALTGVWALGAPVTLIAIGSARLLRTS